MTHAAIAMLLAGLLFSSHALAQPNTIDNLQAQINAL